MHSRKKTEMELIHLILPIVGAFLLLFIVCCCGKKVKEVLHIPKEVVMGRYVLSAQLRESRQNRNQYELAPQSRTSDQMVVDIESTSCVQEDLPKVGAASFEEDCSEFSEITEIKMDTTPNVSHTRCRMSERDSGVYSLLNNSVGSVSTQSGRRQHHSSSSATSDSGLHQERMRHCSSRSETSVIVNVRKASSNNDEEFTIEDAGVCIIHQPTPAEIYSCALLPPPPPPPPTGDVSSQSGDTLATGECSGLEVPSLATLASKCSKIRLGGEKKGEEDAQPSDDTRLSDSTQLCGLPLGPRGNLSLPSIEIENSSHQPIVVTGDSSPVDRRQSCLHTDECKKAANQNRVTFSDSKLQSIESQDSNESVFLS